MFEHNGHDGYNYSWHDQQETNTQMSSQTNDPLELRITRTVLESIRCTIGVRRAEQGGMLGGSRADGIVRHFYFDTSAHRSGATYSPDHELINRILEYDWNPNGINLLGFVHSHPRWIRQPSGGDLDYAAAILKAIPDMPYLIMPIVMTEVDTDQFEFLAYRAVRHGRYARYEKLALVIVENMPASPRWEEPPAPAAPEPAQVETQQAETQQMEANEVEQPRVPATARLVADACRPSDLAETFARVQSAYDLPLLAHSRVVCIGVGGAAGFIEDLARVGVGEFVLIDPDTVSATNLATQQTYRRDLGRIKVTALAERLRDINPEVRIITRPVLLDAIDDPEMESLCLDPWLFESVGPASPTGRLTFEECPPSQTLLCGLTDNFEAQARVNRLALHLGVPSLCAQVYHEGRAAEITFTYPGVTPACHRCALAGRYKAYLENNFTNNVTSNGTPIFATTRLNALKGMIALALLHHKSDHHRWGPMLRRIGNRNLVLLRLDPDAGAMLGIPAFDRVLGNADKDSLCFDEAIWLRQVHDCPDNGHPYCPDCAGTGDLRKVFGQFSDTRKMRHPVK